MGRFLELIYQKVALLLGVAQQLPGTEVKLVGGEFVPNPNFQSVETKVWLQLSP